MEMDKSFDVNLPQFQAIIDKYESLFKELTEELSSVKFEHDTVKRKLSTLVVENQQLSRELSKLQAPEQKQSSSDNEEIVECLKQQIQSLLQEKDHVSKLWQNANKSAELLEQELRVFQSGSENFVPKKDVLKLRQNYEDQIRDLQTKLHIAEKKIPELSKDPIRNDGKYPTENCINLTLENQAGALKIVKNLESEILSLQKRLQESEKALNKLNRNIKEKDEVILKITRMNHEYREKVSEAVQVVQAALNEKDAALFKEREAKDTIDKVNQELIDIMKETEEKIKKEVAKVNMEHMKKQEHFQAELMKLEKEVLVKNLEIEKYSTKCSLLDEELERFRKGNISMDDMNISKLLVLEKNLESTFQKLLLSEKTNIQLVSEKETIKNDMAQMAEHYDRIVKTKEIEKVALQDRIRQFQTDLEETKYTLKAIKEQLNTEKDQKQKLEKEWFLQKEEQERMLKTTLADKLTENEASCKEKISILQMQIESKDQINKKLFVETKDIVENLEKLIDSLKKELSLTKKQNKKLNSQLEEQKRKFDQCKHFLHLINEDVEKIGDMARENKINIS